MTGSVRLCSVLMLGLSIVCGAELPLLRGRALCASGSMLWCWILRKPAVRDSARAGPPALAGDPTPQRPPPASPIPPPSAHCSPDLALEDPGERASFDALSLTGSLRTPRTGRKPTMPISSWVPNHLAEDGPRPHPPAPEHVEVAGRPGALRQPPWRRAPSPRCRPTLATAWRCCSVPREQPPASQKKRVVKPPKGRGTSQIPDPVPPETP